MIFEYQYQYQFTSINRVKNNGREKHERNWIGLDWIDAKETLLACASFFNNLYVVSMAKVILGFLCTIAMRCDNLYGWKIQLCKIARD